MEKSKLRQLIEAAKSESVNVFVADARGTSIDKVYQNNKEAAEVVKKTIENGRVGTKVTAIVDESAQKNEESDTYTDDDGNLRWSGNHKLVKQDEPAPAKKSEPKKKPDVHQQLADVNAKLAQANAVLSGRPVSKDNRFKNMPKDYLKSIIDNLTKERQDLAKQLPSQALDDVNTKIKLITAVLSGNSVSKNNPYRSFSGDALYKALQQAKAEKAKLTKN